MKVKAADEATVSIAKRRSVRWLGVRGMKSKTAEGCYGVFLRQQQHNSTYRLTLLMAVYEPQTARWYTTAEMLLTMNGHRLSLPVDNIQFAKANEVLGEIYKGGYNKLAQARLLGHL